MPVYLMLATETTKFILEHSEHNSTKEASQKITCKKDKLNKES